jgi:predicted O-methyltransferase YrrM
MDDREKKVLEYKKTAEASEIPVVSDEVFSLIRILLKIHGTKSVLEVGSAVGVSSMLFACVIGEGANVTTIEKDDNAYLKTCRNLKTFGFEEQVHPIHADATEYLKTLTPSYDMVFLDAAKGQYVKLLPDCLRILKRGGLLIADDVLFRGMVEESLPVKRRKITIVKRLRAFLESITQDQNLNTSVVHISDGISISLKLN